MGNPCFRSLALPGRTGPPARAAGPPLLGGPAIDAPEAVDLQQQIAATLEELLAAGRQHGSIREDVTVVDLITTGALACRPLPHLPADQATTLATRHVRVFADGLQPAAARPLPAAVPHSEIVGHRYLTRQGGEGPHHDRLADSARPGSA
ncbi:SbtR family transcriptional regulator [Streptomyces sp. NBC_01210]|uniref:SbtR family transcriptional regulator n=1 Tax=Streptomyces sp. NBC_01210 TaxID=2903774 RepID=UPI003FA3D686